jgi:large subunit ribosomal protein L25
MDVVIQAKDRSVSSKSNLRELREQGHIPGVIYGGSVGNHALAVPEKELLAVMRKNPHAVIEIELPTGKQHVLIHQVQRDSLSGQIRHIDFRQINMNKPIETTVSMEYQGEAAGVKAGGILQIRTHEVEVRCLPDDLPSALHADISRLEVGENLHVSDLEVPDKVELLTDPSTVLVSVLAVHKEEETEEPEAAADTPVAEEPEATK